MYEIEEPEEEPYEQAPVEEPVEEPKPASRYVHPVYSNMDISSIPPEQIAHDEPVAESEVVEEEDEVGPEPFLVAQEQAGRPAATPESVPAPQPAPTPQAAPTPVAAAVPEPVIPVFTTPSQPAAPAPTVSPAIEPVAEPARTYPEPERPYAEPAKPASVQPAAAPTHQPTLNELLAASRQSSNAHPEQETSKPVIQDLKRAISLNEKLLFVKDLFDGYNLAYAEAIDLLNKMPDFQTADTFLQKHYATKHNWAAKQSTADKFYDLLRQRFPK